VGSQDRIHGNLRGVHSPTNQKLNDAEMRKMRSAQQIAFKNKEVAETKDEVEEQKFSSMSYLKIRSASIKRKVKEISDRNKKGKLIFVLLLVMLHERS
jgi:hypothetical protein